MDIKLKNIYVSERRSRETIAFEADVYVNNIKSGSAWNDGGGDLTYYAHLNESGKALIRAAEEWCKSLPSFVYIDTIMERTLDTYLYELITEHVRQKNEQLYHGKMEKDMLSAILAGIPGKVYRVWKYPVPIEVMISDPEWMDRFKKHVSEKVLPDLKPMELILNTNIPAETLKRLGIASDLLAAGSHDDKKLSEGSARSGKPKKKK